MPPRHLKFALCIVRRFLALLLLAVCAPVHADLTIRPAAPAEGSMVTIEGMTGCINQPVSYSVDRLPNGPFAIRIRIYDPVWLDAPLLPCPKSKRNRIIVGPVATGDYVVEYYWRFTPDSNAELRATATFTVLSKANSGFPPDWLGHWSDPANPGWGISIDRDAATGHIFAAWYVHERAGNINAPVWLVASNMTTTGASQNPGPTNTSLIGELYRGLATRPFFDLTDTPYSLKQGDRAGNIRIDFTSSTTATLTWSITTSNLFAPTLDDTPAFRKSGSTTMQRMAY